MKVLIVKLSAFGDIIHCLPALNDLLGRPEVSEIHWLVDERYRFVIDILPREVKVHTVSMKGDHPLRSIWHATRKLRSVKFDAVLDLQGLIKSAVISRMCGSPVFGFDKRFLREKPSSLLISSVAFHTDERHVVQYYRRIAAAPFGCSGGAEATPYASPEIDMNKSSCSMDKELLSHLGLERNSYIVLHSSGGWATKQLPARTWLAIANDIKKRGLTPLFSWGNEAEKEQAESYAKQSGGVALPERLGMSELCTLIVHARVVIGADTGLLHLAGALGRPTITFWGPSASWRSGLLNMNQDKQEGVKHWHIESNPTCGPCFKRNCDHFTCMDSIQPASFIKALDEL